jgi:hypothetical protein
MGSGTYRPQGEGSGRFRQATAIVR